MAIRKFRLLLTLNALFLPALVLGCASNSKLATWWPWYEPDQTAELARYGPISRQKIEQLRELRKQGEPPPDLYASLARQLDEENDAMVRLEVVRTLAAYPSDQARSVIAAALKDSDIDVRVAACKALGQLGGPECGRLLGETLARDTSVDVRIAATAALGAMRDPQAVSMLAVALEDPDPALQLSGVEAMRLASGQDFGYDVNRWLQFAKSSGYASPNSELADKSRAAF
jgi:HEAT repeat protein